MAKKVIVIGSGFGGLSTACYLAKAGFDVTVLEKNNQPGGRAMVLRVGQVNGRWQPVNSGPRSQLFTFDMGPSWYMMPDVFEEFFADFDRAPSDYYDLKQLDPSYKVYFQDKVYDVTTAPHVYRLFEQIERGSSDDLDRLLKKTQQEYEMVRRDLLSSSMLTPKGVVNKTAIKLLANPNLLGSYHSRIAQYIDHPDLQKILEFMVVFMGGSPKNIPALYSLLSYVDMKLGVWYPMGGMGKLVDAMVELAHELGVKFRYAHEVTRIISHYREVTGVETPHGVMKCDLIVANADYEHVETKLLDDRQRSYSESYWRRKTMSPSGLLVFLGVKKRLPNLAHHTLFFDSDWDTHFDEVFDKKVWSDQPLFYVCAPSKTDPSVAPQGMENLFLLAPMANGDEPDEQIINRTVDNMIQRIEQKIGTRFADDIIYRDVRAQNYFKSAFNAYRGNAFGLAHTLGQSAIFRPRMKSKTLDGLYYVGQFTNPGTGVPITTLSGKVVGNLIEQTWAKK